MPDLSIIVPAYNEEAALAGTVDEIVRVCGGAAVDFEVVVADDGSDDATPAIIEDLKRDGRVRSVRLDANRGMGVAMRAGIDAARGRWLCFLPADGQFSPQDMLPMLANAGDWDAVAGMVTAEARVQADSVIRVLLSRGMRLASALTHPQAPRFNGILVVRRDRVAALTLVGRTGFVHFEILDRMRRSAQGLSLTFLPVRVRRRAGGASKTANARGVWMIVADMIRLRLNYWRFG